MTSVLDFQIRKEGKLFHPKGEEGDTPEEILALLEELGFFDTENPFGMKLSLYLGRSSCRIYFGEEGKVEVYDGRIIIEEDTPPNWTLSPEEFKEAIKDWWSQWMPYTPEAIGV